VSGALRRFFIEPGGAEVALEFSSSSVVGARVETRRGRTELRSLASVPLGEGAFLPRLEDPGFLAQEELRESVALLGISDVELLGYNDSGMVGWAGNEHPEAFANVPVEQAADRLAGLMERYRPDVVVTYDENGNYGHPDHIQAHRITVAAIERTGIPAKFYHTAIPRAGMTELFRQLRETGADFGDFELPEDFGTPDELITTFVDVSPYVVRKRKALEAHASQGDNIFMLRLPEEAQQQMFGRECFIRQFSTVPVPEQEDDLFAGLR